MPPLTAISGSAPGLSGLKFQCGGMSVWPYRARTTVEEDAILLFNKYNINVYIDLNL